MLIGVPAVVAVDAVAPASVVFEIRLEEPHGLGAAASVSG